MYNAMYTLEVTPSTGDSSADAHDSKVDHDQQADVLSYWNEAQKKLPTLRDVARKFLGITATSVASERVFSKTGYIVSDRRALLKPSKVQELTFVNL
jgi:hypothetical protein